MANTKTSSLSLATLAALSDEVEKIAAKRKPPAPPPATESPRKARLKKFLKNTAVISAGTGVGAGLGTAGDMLIQKYITKSTAPRETKLKWLGAALGLASTGALIGKEWLQHERQEAAR